MATKRQTIHSDDAPAALGPYSQAVRSGDLLFTAGQVGLVPGGGLVGDGVAEQAEQALANLAAVLEAGGCGFGDVLKATIYLVDMGDFATVNEVYAQRFGDAPPARSTVAVAALPAGARVEIDLVARVP